MNAVMELIERRRGELTELCHRYGVERLYLFGSAAAGRFRLPSSDLDFIVEMADRQPRFPCGSLSWIGGGAGTPFRSARRSHHGTVDSQSLPLA